MNPVQRPASTSDARKRRAEAPPQPDDDTIERLAELLRSWGVHSMHGEWTDAEAQRSAARDVIGLLASPVREPDPVKRAIRTLLPGLRAANYVERWSPQSPAVEALGILCDFVGEPVEEAGDLLDPHVPTAHSTRPEGQAPVREPGRRVLLEAADEMEAVIADGDSAEVCAPVSGEVGRSAVVAKRNALYEEPHTWLREYADRMEPGRSEAEVQWAARLTDDDWTSDQLSEEAARTLALSPGWAMVRRVLGPWVEVPAAQVTDTEGGE